LLEEHRELLREIFPRFRGTEIMQKVERMKAGATP
jgi:hypothetical protein